LQKDHYSLFPVCADEDDEELKVDADDQYNFVITDNSDDPNGPTDGITDDDVPVFVDDKPATIPPAPDGQTPYSITFETPDNTEDTPMFVNTPDLTNVKKIIVKINGEEFTQVYFQELHEMKLFFIRFFHLVFQHKDIPHTLNELNIAV
jgi:hypothetical protein